MSGSANPKRSKASVLAEDGTLNPAPEKVSDPKFQADGFFDPRDIVQVKYEMLRRVSIDKLSVTEASDEYRVSRPTFYQARADFEGAGLAGLVPRKRGPRGPHKLQGDVLAFLKAQVDPGEPIRARELTDRLRAKFGLDVHPRTIERALGLKKTAGPALACHCLPRCSCAPRSDTKYCGPPLSAPRCRRRHAAALPFYFIAECGPGFARSCGRPTNYRPLPYRQ